MPPNPLSGGGLGRRSFLAAVPGLLGVVLRQGPQDTTTAGRLYNPNAVQSRARVTAYDNDEYIKGIEKRLKCTCGCNLDIYTCRTTDFTCQSSPALHRQIVALHDEGKDADAILAEFVQEYGEQALMAPPPEGFNLAGYLVPGVAVLAVGTLLAIRLLRHRPDAAVVGAPDVPPPESASPEELERLERALRESGS